MQDAEQLVRFYDEGYTQAPSQAALYARWRALGAIGKADHVLDLCSRAGLSAGGHPINTLEVGCGDGALLSELHRRGFGGRLAGVEITRAAVAIARSRPEIDSVELYDGLHLPVPDGTYELGILSHVLEHVPDPPVLLAEVARACRNVIVEVPLEDNISAKRAVKREHADEVGHLQRLSRDGARSIVTRAGLRIACELEDPLPLTVHRFFAPDPSARARATVKWALRAGLHRLAPSTAQRLCTGMTPACASRSSRPGNSIAYVLATWPKSTAYRGATPHGEHCDTPFRLDGRIPLDRRPPADRFDHL